MQCISKYCSVQCSKCGVQCRMKWIKKKLKQLNTSQTYIMKVGNQLKTNAHQNIVLVLLRVSASKFPQGTPKSHTRVCYPFSNPTHVQPFTWNAIFTTFRLFWIQWSDLQCIALLCWLLYQLFVLKNLPAYTVWARDLILEHNLTC